MKIWFDHCLNYVEDVTLGVHWYKHHKNHPWKGFTITIYLGKYLVQANWVNDWEAYNNRINLRKRKK